MSEYKWTLRERFKVWRYNWIKRPWRNLLWDFRLSPHAREWDRQFPGRRMPRLGKLTRKTMEWAHEASAKLPPAPNHPTP